MIKKIINLFLIMALFSCAPTMQNVAPKPIEKDNKFIEQILRNIITQGIDF